MSDRHARLHVASERPPVSRIASASRFDDERIEPNQSDSDLRLAQRLEAVGRLAAGVAHEISTPMQYVGDSLEFLRTALAELVPVLELARRALVLPQAEQPSVSVPLALAWEAADADFLIAELPRALERSFDGVARVTEIVRAMGAFAHPRMQDRTAANLNDALANTLVISRNEYKYVADVECAFSPLPPVWCRLGEINEVFLNLIVNAGHAVADAVRESNGRGRITVRTRCEGGGVLIEIEDDGAGVPLELHGRIFEPFFTTKPVGKGAGQGLTVARSIVDNHGGALTLRSEPGQGSTFTVFLPLEPSTVP